MKNKEGRCVFVSSSVQTESRSLRGGCIGVLPGQYYDQETGLYYNYFRYYDPSTGRYITADPIGLVAGPNLYAYVSNNPLVYIDPYGLNQMDHGPVGERGPQGFGFQVGTTTMGYSGWGQSGSVGVAAYYEVCEKSNNNNNKNKNKNKNKNDSDKSCNNDDSDPPFASPPDSWSGNWYLMGTTVSTDGTICFQFGLMVTWPPISPNWDIPD